MKIIGQKNTVLSEAKHGKHDGSTGKVFPQDTNLKKGEPSVTTSSFTLDKMKQRLELEPDIRADRVAELKNQIKAGTYQMDTQKLAQNLLQEGLTEKS